MLRRKPRTCRPVVRGCASAATGSADAKCNLPGRSETVAVRQEVVTAGRDARDVDPCGQRGRAAEVHLLVVGDENVLAYAIKRSARRVWKLDRPGPPGRGATLLGRPRVTRSR